MDEVFGRRDLIDVARLRALCVPSNSRGALQTLTHLGAIAASGTLLAYGGAVWWVIPVFMAHGILINFLYAGQHELSHQTAPP